MVVRFVAEFLRKHCLEPGQARAKLEKSGLDQPYTDPTLLARPREHARFLKWASDAGVVEFRLCEKAGLFFVLKKDGDSLRLVIDARRSNSWFADVDPVELASGSLVGDLELEASEKDCLSGPSTLTTPSGDLSFLLN